MKQPLMVVILAVFWVLAVGLTVQDWNDVYLRRMDLVLMAVLSTGITVYPRRTKI